MRLHLSSLQLPVGYLVRPVAYDAGAVAETELDLVMQVVTRIEVVLAGGVDSTREELREQLDGPGVLREETLLVLASDATPVAACWYDADQTAQEIFLETFVDPTLTDADVLRDVLIRHGLEVAGGTGRSGWKVRSGCYQQETAYAQSMQSKGFRRVRSFWRMEIPSDSSAVPARSPELPPGVTVEQGASEEGRRALWEVDQAAFAGHWNFHPRSFDEAWKYFKAESGSRPEYWWLLRVDRVPAALCMLNDSRRELSQAYVSTLGVRREFRRRGLAQLLLRRAFVWAREQGLAATALHVDSENPTGATSLYESVGMLVVQAFDTYELASE